MEDVVDGAPHVGHATGGHLPLQHVAVAEPETFHETLHGGAPLHFEIVVRARTAA